MDSSSGRVDKQVYWFVGAAFGGHYDQTSRFFREGIWENGCKDKYLDLVKSIQVGDRIAIKSSYTRKKGLPFNNNGHSVSVMSIKAKGIVKENMGDGHFLKVDWIPFDSNREWYFYTNRSTVWKVLHGDWKADGLIAFTFQDQQQDIVKFRNAPYWRERFGDVEITTPRFQWINFYEAIADKILTFKNSREKMIKAIHEIGAKVGNMNYLKDKSVNGTEWPLNDICPFTAMGIFNRGLTDANRIKIAKEFAAFLHVDLPVPNSFEGIPVLNNRNSCFFGFTKDRQEEDIDILWDVFEAALNFAKGEEDESRNAFIIAYEKAIRCFGVSWNLTMGLYWIRPWNFLPLDSNSREYIDKKLGMKIKIKGAKNTLNGEDYLALLENLELKFQEDSFPVNSFPELSLEAWKFDNGRTGEDQDKTNTTPGYKTKEEFPPSGKLNIYTIDTILSDGCFLEQSKLENMLGRLKAKKNLILQGPPGTGKTWLSKRLAFALIGAEDNSRVRAVQFHPNLSYEDFVRGLRPSINGGFELVDGPLLEMSNVARNDPSYPHVLVIEEINRGNPAQILGEMLTLLESDKRKSEAALELCYRRSSDEYVYIPENLYVIGTMNVADRSIALVDLALRRRFAFVKLEPVFGEPWYEWVENNHNIEHSLLKEIEKRIKELNEKISSDISLGPQFNIGHSYVTPSPVVEIQDGVKWFKQVVETEIKPLLEEYWFDNLEKAQKASFKLIEGL